MVTTRTWGEFVYAPPDARREGIIVPDRNETHHLFRVRRVAAGDSVWVTDGEGTTYRCAAMPEHTLRIVETYHEFGEPKYALTLCMAFLRSDSLREALDAATQLGTTDIILFPSERSETRGGHERQERLQRILISAVKQCGRARLPRLATVSNLSQALSLLPEDLPVFFAHPLEDSTSQSMVRWTGPQALVVGPEGGFSEHELETALHHGCIPLTLAARRLRSETAVAAGLAFLLTRWGECG